MTDTAPTAVPGGDDAYATWDAPYVLGALDRAERWEFEAHLAQCARCREAVAELAGMPGLLGQVNAGVALSLVDSVPGEPTAYEDPGAFGHPAASAPMPTSAPMPAPIPLSRLATRAREERRRGRALAAAGAVAAAVAAAAIAIPVTTSLSESPAPAAVPQVVAERSMDPVVPSPITASFRVVAVPDGTRVEMTCSYAPSATQYTWQGSMWVLHADGTQSMIAQWTAQPGETVAPDGTTAAPPDQIRSIEIRSTASNQALLRSSL
ncbi:zf-HC2 domain-containing protein [Nocardia sp. BMG51109]|uniref:zf-HC2 domain-containing protein n=1 Tax=Nocardia sp. BMG51109 TaxID=1056816 RepID=UPI0004652C78|nr:zf-HC2 domain-containing protein [Nocardia sp. BMG51109]